MTSERTHTGAVAPPPVASSSGCLPDDAGAAPGVGLDLPSSSSGAAPLHIVKVDGDPEPLFGVGDDDGRVRPPLETAVRRTLSALDREGALTDADAGRVALAVELSQIIADKRATRRTSTVGNDARVLMDILDELAPAAATESDKLLRRAMDEWTETIRAQEAAARRAQAGDDDARRAEVRD